MSNVINLNELMNRTLPIKIGDKTIAVREISMAQFERMLEIEAMEGMEAMEAQVAFLAETMSNNAQKRTFSMDEIRDMPRSVVGALWQSLVLHSVQPVADPN